MSFTIKNGTIVHYEESGTLEKLKLKKTAEAVATPAKATRIGDEAFLSAGLVRINVSSGVTDIGDKAFSLCKHLQTVSLPIRCSTLAKVPLTAAQSFRRLRFRTASPA